MMTPLAPLSFSKKYWVQQYMLNNTTRMRSTKPRMWAMVGEGAGFFDRVMGWGWGKQGKETVRSERSGDLRDK